MDCALVREEREGATCGPDGSPLNPKNTLGSREKMAEIMFETFKVPAINVAIPARLLLFVARVAEVLRRHEGPSPKRLDSDENVKP